MLPDVGSLPDHAPDAVHAEALLVDQLSVDVLPGGTSAGLNDIVTVGAGGGFTVSVALPEIFAPAEFWQVRV
jgi:hypothetical protein